MGDDMSRKISILFILVFSGVWFLNCAHKNGAPMEKKSNLQKVYVEAIKPQSVTVTSSDLLKIKVEGNLPNPAYSFERFDVVVKEDVIEITPLAKHDADKIVMQVLVPFEEVCEVKNLKPGTYEIKVVSRSDTVVSKEKVRVQ